MENTEQTLWEGTPSQYINVLSYLCLGLLAPLIVPLFIILITWLRTSTTRYKLTNQRFIETTGILSKNINEVEFYRVRDYTIRVPFIYRFFDLSDVVLITSDKSHPSICIRGVRDGIKIRDQIRGLVEEAKKIRKVSEIDIE